MWTRVTHVQSMAATDHGCPSCVLSHFSRVQLLVTLWTAPHQAPLSLGLPREECWSGLLRSPPRGLPDPGIKAVSSVSCVGRRVLYHWCHLSPQRPGSKPRGSQSFLSGSKEVPEVTFAINRPAFCFCQLNS